MTLRFRQDNTDGYSDADLAALNAAFEQIMKANAELWANDVARSRFGLQVMAGPRGRGTPVPIRPRPPRRRADNEPMTSQ
jgi:hypothetical protein